ncbi:MAG: Ig-like domain-containing protein, partial [Terriglobales bacterium]
MHNPTTLQGVVVKRNPSTDPQGNPIVAQLWVDNDDDGVTDTNVSSFLLMSPTAGFTGGLVTEVETLCFYNSSIWTPSLTPPAGCSTVGSTPSSTTLKSSLSPSVYGQSVIFTAAVTASSGTPTGSVIFTDTSTATTLGSATLVNGTASLSSSSLAAGTHSITATYQGSATFAGSTSAPVSQSVSIATTTTTIASSQNPAGTSQAVIFTATVASQFGGAATGSVTFFSGSQTLGTASLSGNIASLTASFATAGTYSVSAKYNGDSNDLTGASPTLTQAIISSTTTTLVSSLNPSAVGQAVSFTASVSSTGGTPPNGGTITFKNGSVVLGAAPLSAGMASLTTSSLPAGVYTITATYGGNANFAASTSPGLKQVVNNTTKSATATTLGSSLNPSIYGQPVTWMATVTTSGPVPPTGKVIFMWAGNFIGTATLNVNGVATLTQSNFNADSYPITAEYVGDVNNLGSTSAFLNQVVTETTSAATLSSSPNPTIQAQAVTF